MLFMFFKSKPQTSTTPLSGSSGSSGYSPPQGSSYQPSNDLTGSLPFKQKFVTPHENLQGTNLVEEHIKATIQNVIDQSDPTLALIIQVPAMPNQKKRFIDFQSFGTFLLNYGGSDFPSGISMCITQINGYVNEQGNPTNIVATCKPGSISTVLNPGGIIGYNVVYNGENNPIWDITGINTLHLKIKLFGDTDYRPLPAAQPIQLGIKISRVIF